MLALTQSRLRRATSATLMTSAARMPAEAASHRVLIHASVSLAALDVSASDTPHKVVGKCTEVASRKTIIFCDTVGENKLGRSLAPEETTVGSSSEATIASVQIHRLGARRWRAA